VVDDDEEGLSTLFELSTFGPRRNACCIIVMGEVIDWDGVEVGDLWMESMGK